MKIKKYDILLIFAVLGIIDMVSRKDAGLHGMGIVVFPVAYVISFILGSNIAGVVATALTLVFDLFSGIFLIGYIIFKLTSKKEKKPSF